MDKSGEAVFEKARRYESIVYAVLWLMVLILPFFNEFMRMTHQYQFSWCNVMRWLIGIIPFFIVFFLNNYLLVPRYLFTGRVRQYLVLVTVMVAMFVAGQYLTYESRISAFHEKVEQRMEPSSQLPAKVKYTFIGIPMPIILNLSLVLMLLGTNTAIIFIFRYVRERQIREALENIRLQDEIRFLKAQINPHFFMNTLNNIHALIDIDSVKAQEAVIGLSKMMRHVLYDAHSAFVPLEKEIEFLNSYVELMRLRYTRALNIKTLFPHDIEGYYVPSLLFVSFLENAFKHGVSYNKESVISVGISIENGFICFNCFNSCAKECNSENSNRTQQKGIGIDNVRKRLSLMYGEAYSFEIEKKRTCFNVVLKIPVQYDKVYNS